MAFWHIFKTNAEFAKIKKLLWHNFLKSKGETNIKQTPIWWHFPTKTENPIIFRRLISSWNGSQLEAYVLEQHPEETGALRQQFLQKHPFVTHNTPENHVI